jgi:hypothetical protein
MTSPDISIPRLPGKPRPYAVGRRPGPAEYAQAVKRNRPGLALHSVEARFYRWLLSCRDRIDNDTVSLTQEFLADMLGGCSARR